MIKKASCKFYLLIVILFYSIIVYSSCGIPLPFPNITLPITTEKSITVLSTFDLNSERINVTFDNEITEPLSGFKVYYKDIDGFIKPAILYWRDSGSNAVYNNDYIAVTAVQLNAFALQSPHFSFYFVKDSAGSYETDSNTGIVINYTICDDKEISISSLFKAGERISIYFVPMVYMDPPIDAVVPINAFSSSVNKTEIIFSN